MGRAHPITARSEDPDKETLHDCVLEDRDWVIVVSEVVLICRPQSHSSNKPNMKKNVAMWK